jgi:hypothetical protein
MARQGEGGRVMSLREFIDETMTETQFQEKVLELAELRKWKAYHTFDSRKSEAGFPDLTLVRRGRLIFAELKSAKGKVREAQEEWVAQLSRVDGIEVHIWRPEHWSVIKEVLA